MSQKLCKRCEQPKMEYYPRRNTCKECVRAYQRDYIAEHANPSAETATCSVCKIVKSTDRFKISRKTKLLKDTCIDCKMPKGVNIRRYNQLNEWVDNLIKQSKSEDVRILKHLFEKI